MGKKITAIVQARMGSSRLPGKVLKILDGKKVIEHVFDRLALCKNIHNIVLATTTSKKDDVLEDWAIKNNVGYFRGDEEDVLSRYYNTAKKFNADVVVRITSDCPFIDYKIVDRVIDHHLEKNVDYTSNVHPPSFPDGLDVEVFSFDALSIAKINAKELKEREHVTPFIWDKNNNFKCQNFINDMGDMSDLRFTLDTKEDYELMKEVVKKITVKNFTLVDLIEFVKCHQNVLLLNEKFKRNENF